MTTPRLRSRLTVTSRSLEFSRRVAIVGIGFALVTACRSSAPLDQSTETLSQPSNANSSQLPPPPPSAAFIAQLSPAQTAQIKAQNLPLVVPTAIPAGFSVAQVVVEQSDRFAGYQILYRDEGDRCFLIEYAASEVNNVAKTENRISVSPPFLTSPADYGLNYGPYVDPNLKAQVPEPQLISDWLPIHSGFYRLAGAAYINDILPRSSTCQDISPETALSLLQSSALITDEIQGDGAPSQ